MMYSSRWETLAIIFFMSKLEPRAGGVYKKPALHTARGTQAGSSPACGIPSCKARKDKSGIHNRPARPPGADRKNPGKSPCAG